MTMPEILRRKLMERIDIASEPDDGEVLEEIDGLILGEEETRYLPVAQKAELRRQLFYSVRRLDVLQELLEDAGITEIMVNGYQHIFVERNGRIERYGKSFTSAEKLEDVIQQIVGRCNRVVNEQNPIVDARLENGDRVNVVMKPVALNGPILTIRRFPEQAVTMEFLVSIGSITKEAAAMATVYKYSAYSSALDIIDEKVPDLVKRVRSGQLWISQANIIELSGLSKEQLLSLNNYLLAEKIEHLSYHDMKRELLWNNYAKPILKKESSVSIPSIRNLPQFDPDAEIASLTLTIPSWNSSIERVLKVSDFKIASDTAKYKLKYQLMCLISTTNNILKKLEEI